MIKKLTVCEPNGLPFDIYAEMGPRDDTWFPFDHAEHNIHYYLCTGHTSRSCYKGHYPISAKFVQVTSINDLTREEGAYWFEEYPLTTPNPLNLKFEHLAETIPRLIEKKTADHIILPFLFTTLGLDEREGKRLIKKYKSEKNSIWLKRLEKRHTQHLEKLIGYFFTEHPDVAEKAMEETMAWTTSSV
jgi:hypothetical protein